MRNIKDCKKICANDVNCTAFHFYLLDPGAFNNCWIWIESGYTPNGSDKAYCYTKNENFQLNESDQEEVEIDEELEKLLEE